MDILAAGARARLHLPTATQGRERICRAQPQAARQAPSDLGDPSVGTLHRRGALLALSHDAAGRRAHHPEAQSQVQVWAQAEERSMSGHKIDWSLSSAERELLQRDCRESKVPIAVDDRDAIKRVVGLISKAGDRRDAAR